MIGLDAIEDFELVVWDFEIPTMKKCYVNLKIEYIDDNVYPHVLRVDGDYIQIFSTELVEGAATVEIKDSDGNPINVEVNITSDSGYRFIEISHYNSNITTINNYYQALQEGKNITVTVKQGNNSYTLGGSTFEESNSNEYDCYHGYSKYYYWGNNKIGFLTGC